LNIDWLILSKNFQPFWTKCQKKKQDLKVDLPTVGYDTVKYCKKVGLKGIVLKSGQNIVLDKKKIIIRK